MKKNSGITLWNKAKKLIPGGTQLLSKRSEMFLPEQWPCYFRKASGIEVEDLDGNKYLDLGTMGIGACLLGYADKDVNAAVKKVIDAGSMCTLNSPEEVELAELLTDLHPWADEVRYARCGGESMAIAVRIARAHSKKDKVAFCGYHGWHDWYLASNLASNKNLDGHLIPGLDPLGVPRGLIHTALPFEYNKIEQLREIVKKNDDVGVIVVEALRHQDPLPGFFDEIEGIAQKIGAVFIVDEVSSGWRNNVGGAHLIMGVHPDIAVFAKGMSNGYPMGAVIGKKEVMDAAQESFISSTYWTERVGPTAAIATINKLKKYNVPDHILKIGGLIGENWKKIADKHGLDINILGPNSLITFELNYKNAQELKTLFNQEMLRRGYLANTTVYVSYSHKQKYLKDYFESIDEVFGILKKAVDNNNATKLLHGPVAHVGFKRLT
jgi:glutamate-1-semialdehyde 2,1-aminomutase